MIARTLIKIGELALTTIARSSGISSGVIQAIKIEMKKETFNIYKVIKSATMIELKRNLPLWCYLDRLGAFGKFFNGVGDRQGFKSFLKGVAQNQFTPVEIRKMWYVIDTLRRGVRKDLKIKGVKNQLKLTADDFKGLSNDEKIGLLINIDDAFGNKKQKELGKLINKKDAWIEFKVNSPQTHNFEQSIHKYNFITMDYKVPIRGASWNTYKYYTYKHIKYSIIVIALEQADYGKIVFERFRTT